MKTDLVFRFLLFSSISLHYSLKKAFLFLLAILWNSAFRQVYFSFSPFPFTSLLFSAISKACSDNHFVFFQFLFLGNGFGHHFLYNVKTLCPYFFRHSSGLIPWIYLSLSLFNHKGCDLGHTWMAYFLQFKSEFCNKEFMIWTTVSPRFWFRCLYRASPSSAAKNIINLIAVLTIWWCPRVEWSLVCWKWVFSMTSAFSWPTPPPPPWTAALRILCPLLCPGVCLNSYPYSQWCCYNVIQCSTMIFLSWIKHNFWDKSLWSWCLLFF